MIMKKTSLIIFMLFIGISLYGQTNKGYLSVSIEQIKTSYTLNSEKDVYHSGHTWIQNTCKLVHDADSSYIVYDGIIPFTMLQEGPRFQGGLPEDFSKWTARKIREILLDEHKCTLQLTIDFTISPRGELIDAVIMDNLSDKENPSLQERILGIVKSSPKWVPEKHFRELFYTPLRIIISLRYYGKEIKDIRIPPFDDHLYRELADRLWEDSPNMARVTKIPGCQIASDDDIDSKAYIEDVDLNQWIKTNVQDVTDIIGFEDGKSILELVISSNGWVAEANIVESDDMVLGEYLTEQLLESCPRWIPATTEGENVPSRVLVNYEWRF